MDYPDHWYQETQYDHDIYVMVIKEPVPPGFCQQRSEPKFSYVGRLVGHGQHPSFSLHFVCPPYGNDYPTHEAALQAGLAHSRALIEHWCGRPRKLPVPGSRWIATPLMI